MKRFRLESYTHRYVRVLIPLCCVRVNVFVSCAVVMLRYPEVWQLRPAGGRGARA